MSSRCQQTPPEKASEKERQRFWCFCAPNCTSLTYQREKFTGPLIHTDLSLCAVYVIVDHRLDLNPLLDPHHDTEDVIESVCLAVCASPSSVWLCREQKCGKIWGVEWRQLRVQKKPVLAKWLVCELISHREKSNSYMECLRWMPISALPVFTPF